MSAEHRIYTPEQIVALFVPSEPPANIDDFGPVKYVGHFKPFPTEAFFHRKNDVNNYTQSKSNAQTNYAHTKNSPPKEVPNHPQIMKGPRQKRSETPHDEERTNETSTQGTKEVEKQEVKTFSFDSVINEIEEEEGPATPDIQEAPTHAPHYSNQNLFPTNAQLQFQSQQLPFQQQFYQNSFYEQQNKMPMFPTKSMKADFNHYQSELNKDPQPNATQNLSSPQSPTMTIPSPFNTPNYMQMPNSFMQVPTQPQQHFNAMQMQAQLQFMQFMQLQMNGQIPQFNMFNKLPIQNMAQPLNVHGPVPNVFFTTPQQPTIMQHQQPKKETTNDCNTPMHNFVTAGTSNINDQENTKNYQTHTDMEERVTGIAQNRPHLATTSDKQRSGTTKDRRFAPYVPAAASLPSKVASFGTISDKPDV